MRGLIVTGTDTGVGKTAVTCAIARVWRREGRSFAVRKPVSTGGNADALELSEASGQSAAEITAFVFGEPAAPPVAAAAEGRVLAMSDLLRVIGFPVGHASSVPLVRMARMAGTLDACSTGAAHLIEAVGGLLCPLTDTETVADFAGLLRLPLVIVARRSLGTLNHTLMTVEIARHRGLKIAGVVVSETEPVEGLAARTAVDEMRRRGVPVLAVLRHGEAETTPPVDWWSLAEQGIE